MITLPQEVVRYVIVNGSQTRYIVLPAGKKTDSKTAVLFVAGQKSPLERFYPMIEYLSQFFRTYAYEVPGMGLLKRRKDSPATIETLGQELGEFITTTIKEPNVIIVAGSAGFWFSTQALLQSEEAKQKTKKVISIAGLLGKETFGFSPIKRLLALWLCQFSISPPGLIFADWFLNSPALVKLYSKYLIAQRQFSFLPVEVRKDYEEFEAYLLLTSDWGINFSTLAQYLTTSVHIERKLTIPLLALYSSTDEFFPLERQKSAFSRVYNNIEWAKVDFPTHAPVIVRDYREYQKFFPQEKIERFLIS